MLLVHGWGVSGALFEEQITALSSRFRMVVPDLPGHGSSPAWPRGAPFSHLADRLAELVDELGLRDICLVGWSLGAMVAWDLLSRHAEAEVGGLVTIDMVPRLLNDDGWSHGLRAGRDHQVFARQIELMSTDWPRCVALFVPRIFAAAAPRREHLIGRAGAVALRNEPQSMAAVWQQMVEQDFRAVLPGIRMPALVVAGAQSQLYGVAAAEWVAAQMPHAQLAVFGGSGHAPHLEQPEDFNQALSEFAGSLQALRVPGPDRHTGTGIDN
jgi:pimeloyl-[acyl-carrier protein] methyl ester esterase